MPAAYRVDHHQRALVALAKAAGSIVAYPPDAQKLAAAIFHTSVALQEMAKADPEFVACDLLLEVLDAELARRRELVPGQPVEQLDDGAQPKK